MRIIVDDIGAVVAGMRAITEWGPEFKDFNSQTPYYMYGHPLEINNRLLNKEKDAKKKYEKYPLVALRLDTPEIIGNTVINYNLNIVLIAFSDKLWNAEQRYDKNFRQILYPMYEAFMLQLYNSGLFVWQGGGESPSHTKIDRPYWGNSAPQKNDAYIFSDPLDAIEILNLKINSTKSC